MKTKTLLILLVSTLSLALSGGCGRGTPETSGGNGGASPAVTEPETEEMTQPKTEKPTEAPTEAPTEPPTESPTEKPTQPPTEKPTEPPTEAVLDSTVRTEVKEAIDAYETFIDDYIAFMSNYNSLSEADALSFAADYAKFLADYATNVSKFEALDSDLTVAEEAYYTEVSLRVTDKLLKFETSLASDAITDSGDWGLDFDTDWDTDWETDWDADISDFDFGDFGF